MTVFPMMIPSAGKKCLVAGGGKVALHKIRILLQAEFAVLVTAPEILPEIRELPVKISQRKVRETDLEGIFLAVDATGDRETGIRLSNLCRERNIPLNVVDCPELCDFIFPAMLRKGKLTAAVSTAGVSPIAAQWVRDQIEDLLPEAFPEILEQMDAIRPEVRREISNQKQRAAYLKKCFAAAVERGRILTGEELKELWKNKQEAYV